MLAGQLALIVAALFSGAAFYVGWAEHYARLFVQLKRAGTPIPDNDLWIAAVAIEHDLALVTRDRHFDKLPQLRRAMA